MEDYRKQQNFNKRLELINKIDECQKIIIISVSIAVVPLILLVTNLESLGVLGTIILAFLAIFSILGKGTGRSLPFFLLIYVPLEWLLFWVCLLLSGGWGGLV